MDIDVSDEAQPRFSPYEVHQAHSAGSVVEKLDESWGVGGGYGSFDFVRLTPHCAQDDKLDH